MFSGHHLGSGSNSLLANMLRGGSARRRKKGVKGRGRSNVRPGARRHKAMTEADMELALMKREINEAQAMEAAMARGRAGAKRKRGDGKGEK